MGELDDRDLINGTSHTMTRRKWSGIQPGLIWDTLVPIKCPAKKEARISYTYHVDVHAEIEMRIYKKVLKKGAHI